MYRLLIVDDEPIITDVLYDMFSDVPEPELDVYRAYSGNEALELVKKARIDIVMTDICMPDITGLELQKEIKQHWPQCRVIFLTGYNEFDYVQTAIRNDGVDYILKTEGDEAILQAVKKAAAEIERELESAQLVEKAKHSMKMAIPLLQEKFLQDMFDGVEYTPEERRNQFCELDIPLDYEMPVILLIGRVDLWPKQIKITEQMKIIYGIRNAADNFFSGSVTAVPVIYERTRLLWLIQPVAGIVPPDDANDNKRVWERVVLYVHETMGSIQDACKELFKISTSFVVSGEPVPWESVSEKFDSLKFILNKAGGLSNEMLLIEHDMQVNLDGDYRVESQNEEEKAVRLQLKRIPLLEDFLESGQKEEFMDLYSAIMDAVKKNRHISYDLKKEIYYSITPIFLSYINRWNIAGKNDCSIDFNKLTKLEEHSSWDEVVIYFKELADCMFEQKNTESFKNANRVFGFIKNYTESHIDGDLSLTKFADLLHFHPFYLSRLFKQVTGKSLSEYIAGIKVEKARELLKQSNMKVNEVASALGFETASYFTRFFKKYTNFTPQEYKDSTI